MVVSIRRALAPSAAPVLNLSVAFMSLLLRAGAVRDTLLCREAAEISRNHGAGALSW
jgi:hypothetical protein